MANLNDGLGILALVQSYDAKAINKAEKEILAQINNMVGDINSSFDKVGIDKNAFNKLIEQLKSLPKELRQKTQGISFDFLNDLINADGAEEKIDEALRMFSNKIDAFSNLRSKINNDEIVIKTDSKQLDELIKKEERLLELEKELNSWQNKETRTKGRTKKSITTDISDIEGQIKNDISNLNISDGQIGIDVDNKELEKLEKGIKSTEEALKSARKEADLYGKSLADLKKEIEVAYNKSVNKDTNANAQVYRKAVQNYIKAGGSQKDLDQDYIDWYKMSGLNWEKDFIPLDKIKSDAEAVQQEVQKLESRLDSLKKKRDELLKGSKDTSETKDTIGSVIDEQKLKEQNDEMEKIKAHLAETETQLNQINQKYEDQNNLVTELENKLKEVTSVNDKNIVDAEEFKTLSSQLDDAKKKVNELETELKQTKEVLKLLQDNVGSASGEVISKNSINNAEAVINNLKNRIKELETSMSSGEQQAKELADALAKLQQEKTNLSEQLSQQKQLNAEQEKQVSNYQIVKAELALLQGEYKELTASIKEMENTQRQYMSLLDNFGNIEAFNKAIKNIGYNEGQNTPEGFINFDYLEKTKQKLEETGNAYEKTVKAAVYYNQYLQKGGTEKIFSSDGKDISDYLKSVYKEMSVLADSKTGLISEESIINIVRQYANELIIARKEQEEDRKLIAQKNKELEKSLAIEKNISNTRNQRNVDDEQISVKDTKSKQTVVSNNIKNKISREAFIEKLSKEQEKRINDELINTEQQAIKTNSAVENVGNNVSEQDKLQSELKDTKTEIQEIGNEAQQSEEKVKSLGNSLNVGDVGKNDEGTGIKGKEEQPLGFNGDSDKQQKDQSSIASEQETLEKLKTAINSVKDAINLKTSAIKSEEEQMNTSVDAEIAKLKELENALTTLKSQFLNGLSGIFKNPDGGSIFNLEQDVNLKPAVDADKFKSDAERLLAFVDVNKEVDLKVGKASDSADLSPISSEAISDDVIEEQNKDLEEQQFLYNNIIKLLNDYASLLDKINSGNKDIINDSLIYDNDIRKQTGKVSQRAVKDQLNNYLNMSENKDGIYSNNSINRAKEQLAAYVANFNDAEKAAEIFGKKNKDLFDKIIQMINQARVSQEAYNEAQVNMNVANSQIAQLNKLQGNEALTNSQVWNIEKVLNAEGVDSAIKYITDSLGIKIPEAAQKAESAIGDVQQEFRELDDGEKQDKTFKVPLKLLIDQTEWEAQIDAVIAAINKNPKKVIINPDLSSKEWTEFKTFINDITEKVIKINLNGNDSISENKNDNGDVSSDGDNNKNKNGGNSKKSTTLPSELSESYKNSAKYLKQYWDLEEEIAKVKEANNGTDLNSLSILEEKKKETENLLKIEEQFRANEKYKDYDTSSKDNSLNKINETRQQEYDSNRNVAAIQAQNIIKANELLEQQKIKWQEIQNINVEISKLDPFDNADEINNLNIQKASLENELNTLKEESKLYDSLIDKKKQAKELDKISSNANTQINDNISKYLNNLYAELNNNIRSQTKLNVDISNTPAENQERLNSLQDELNEKVKEYASLIDRVNKALSEEYSKSKNIDKTLDKLRNLSQININNITDSDNANSEYLSIKKIADAITEASNRMRILKNDGKSDIFQNAFQNAEMEVDSLNNSLMNGQITLTEYRSAFSKIVQDLKLQENAVGIVNPEDIADVDNLRATLKEYINYITNAEIENEKFNESGQKLSGTFKNAKGEIQDVSVSIKTLSDGTKIVTSNLGTTRKEVTNLSKFMDELSMKFRNLGSYLLSFVGFYEVWGAIRQGVTYVRELDSALTEMRKVSDETVSSLKEFQQESFNVAESVGSTAKEIQNSTAEWLKLGYAMEDASKLAETTAIYKAVGDNIDIEEATASMISTLEGFQLEAEDATSIINKFNEVSNRFAIDSKGIGDALQRSAASFSAANTGLSESIALITATMKIKWLNIWKHILRIYLIAGKSLKLYTTIIKKLDYESLTT